MSYTLKLTPIAIEVPRSRWSLGDPWAPVLQIENNHHAII